jgi:hypothetical protein
MPSMLAKGIHKVPPCAHFHSFSKSQRFQQFLMCHLQRANHPAVPHEEDLI